MPDGDQPVIPTRASFGRGRATAAEDDFIVGTARAHLGVMRPIIWCHGATGTTVGDLAEPTYRNFFHRLGNIGLVGCGDLGFDTYGNDTASARVEAMRILLVAKGAADAPALLVGASMGGCVALNYALTHPENVAAVAGIIPLVDLADGLTEPALAPGINAAYGGAYDDATHGPDHSPVQFAADLPADLPVRLWWSSNDTYVPPSTIAAFKTARPQTITTDLGPVGHVAGSVQAAVPSVLAWLLPQSRPTPA